MAVLAFVGGPDRASGAALEGVPWQRTKRNGALPAGGGGAARVIADGGDVSRIRRRRTNRLLAVVRNRLHQAVELLNQIVPSCLNEVENNPKAYLLLGH